MMTKVEITNDRTKEINSELKEAVRIALLGCGEQATQYAVEIVPVDTGRLKGSIGHTYSEDEQTEYIGTNVEYAPYVEFGTSRQRAQPYLKPAVANHTDEYVKFIEETIKSRVK